MQTNAAAASEEKIVFLHIAKTAGTSLVQYFSQQLGAGAVMSHGDFLAWSAAGELPEAEVRRCRFVSGHFGYRQIERYLPGAYSFTFLRDPVERALSLFQFCQHSDIQEKFAMARAARELGLEAWLSSQLPEVVEVLHNQQVWQLASMYWQDDRRALAHLSDDELVDLAFEHAQRLSFVGLTEHFAEDFARIIADLQLPAPPTLPRALKSAPRPDRTTLPEGVVEALQERLQPEYQLYQRVRGMRALA